MLKLCSKCKQPKEISEFAPDKRTRDGRMYMCRACHSAYQRELRERGRLGQRQRKQEWNREWYRRWAAANREKMLAHKAVQRALKKGVLIRPAACGCGSTARIVAHHDDYARQLDVRWLCALCHNAHHGNEKIAGRRA